MVKRGDLCDSTMEKNHLESGFSNPTGPGFLRATLNDDFPSGI